MKTFQKSHASIPIVSIRPVVIEDVEFVQTYASDPVLAATCNVPHPYPSDGGIAFVQRSIEARKRRERFPSAVLADGKFVGIVGLNCPDFTAKTIETDYWIAVPYWGLGIGTKAVAYAVRYAFEELQIETVFSGCLIENPASGRILEKNGFVETGTLINDGTYGQKFLGQTLRRFRLNKTQWKGSSERIC